MYCACRARMTPFFQQYKIILGYFVLLALVVLCGAFWAAKTITARILRPLENLNLEQPDSEAVVYLS